MDPDTDPFVFPDLPDEAVAAIHGFVEEFYLRFQNHYFAQMHRWYHEPDERQAHLDLMSSPSPSSPLDDPPF
jgi:hypothetical protein